MGKDKNDIVVNENNNNLKLSIVCHTYNQEKYIRETLEGFLNQKTNFSFEIITHDDASTDSTPQIINEYQEKYPELIKTILQKDNKYSKNINIWTKYTFPKCQGKYIAICEGDDYWTDEKKLQKQVDFLENNAEYVVTWTDYLNYNGTDFKENDFGFSQEIITIDYNNIFNPYCTYSLTTVFLKSALDMNLLDSLKDYKDNSIYMLLLRNGNGAFMNFCSSVYRIHEGGVYSLKSLHFQRYSSYLNLKEIYDLVPESHTKNIQKTLNTFERNAAFEALKIKYNSDTIDKEQENLIKSYFSKASLPMLFRYYKRIFQYKFLNKK